MRVLLIALWPALLGAQGLTRANWLAMGGGFATGALFGARGLSFASVPPGVVTAHRVRAALTYGTMTGVIAGALSMRKPTEGAPHRFWIDRWNTPLFLGVIGIQAVDYASTRYFRDRGKAEWLLTNHLVDDRTAFVATEIGAVATSVGISYILHQTGHHRWERAISFAHITMGGVSAYANYRYPRTGHALFSGQ